MTSVAPRGLPAVPAELREEDRWLVWRYERRDGKRTKVPYASTGGSASSTDPGTWSSFDAAVAARETARADGIGFVLGDGWMGVDLDGVLDETGAIVENFPLDEVGPWIGVLDSYTERSPSGRGLHVLGRGEIPAGFGNRRGPVEVYGAGRYFTVTGDVFQGLATVRELRELEPFLDAVGLRKPDPSANGHAATVPVQLDDRDLLNKAMGARNGAKFSALWNGDTDGYPSRSEADHALCSLLAFWAGRDIDSVDRLFRASGLMRPKWDERRGATTYGAQTVERAVAGTRDVYVKPRETSSVRPQTSTPAPREVKTESDAGITWARLSGIAMRSIVFVDKPLLQADAFHLVCGRKGMGKGTLLAEIASRVTRGELGPKRNVVWIGSEDSNAIDIHPRIVAAGGDPDRVLVVTRGWIQLPRDVEEISRAMDEMGGVGQLVIDPLGNHIAGKESNSETDIRDAIAPLNQLADRHACMVFGVRHLTEKEAKQGVLAAILGSSAWVQVPRAVLAVAKDDDDSEISHVQCVAGNRLPPGTPGRMFRIEGVLLDGLENEVTRVAWLGDSSKNVEAMLSSSGGKQPSKSANARELILDILDDEGQQESDAFDARIADAIGIAAKTVRNLRGELGKAGLIKAVAGDKNDDGTVAKWYVARTLAPR